MDRESATFKKPGYKFDYPQFIVNIRSHKIVERRMAGETVSAKPGVYRANFRSIQQPKASSEPRFSGTESGASQRKCNSTQEESYPSQYKG